MSVVVKWREGPGGARWQSVASLERMTGLVGVGRRYVGRAASLQQGQGVSLRSPLAPATPTCGVRACCAVRIAVRMLARSCA